LRHFTIQAQATHIVNVHGVICVFGSRNGKLWPFLLHVATFKASRKLNTLLPC